MGFSRQEYWSGLPCPPPGDFPDIGIKPVSPEASALQPDSLLLSKWWSLIYVYACVYKGPYSQSYVFSSSHVWIWELDHKEGWVPKNWCFLIVLEKTFESPLDSKKIKLVNPKGSQPWIFIGRTDAEASIVWPPDAKGWLIGQDPDSGKDWKPKEKGVAKDELVR